ncbi:hypothetical protein FHX42_001864 [Saccharopolyspora lacisalsi]|uniref:Uncharacterized protein n=1 Tax=Halosaccharopolyspora lacisalsi TaxID=1000566 RepID=A0A839DYF7_9PSEU|nr:hypothetical protein [Halosaccharopolyspora lacisalsi]
MDITGIVNGLAGELVTHQGKLEGRAAGSHQAQTALESAADSVREQRDAQRKAAETLVDHWTSNTADAFEKKSAMLGKDLATTAEASAQAAKIVAEVIRSLDGRHTTVGDLISDFVTKASQFLKAGLAALGIAAPAGLMRVMASVSDLANRYIHESGGQLKEARAELEEAARKLRALQKELDADGVADPDRSGKKPAERGGEGGETGKEDGKDGPNSAKVEKILDNAREHLGYHEGPNNQNKWGPTGSPWCSFFATSMWQDAGVDVKDVRFHRGRLRMGTKTGHRLRPGSSLRTGTPR